MSTETGEQDILHRNYKDSVFRLVFGEPEKMIEIYNAIFDTDYPPDTEIDINTIEEVFHKTQKNDISFTLAGKYVVLSEHQSTVNPNMPLRDLLYITEIWKGMFAPDAVYKERLVRLPRPTFIVLYNGLTPLPPVTKLELSDCFLGEGESLLNLSVMVYNVNEGAGCGLLEKSPTLAQYSQLGSLVRSYQAKGPVTNRVMQEIVEICLEKGILVELMEKHGRSIIDILHFEITQEEAMEMSREDGYEAGLSQGISQGTVIGQERVNTLVNKLLELNRLDDLKKSTSDAAFQAQLFEEFGI